MLDNDNSFITDFNLSYMEYCKKNEIEEPDEDTLNDWAKKTENKYQYDDDINDVMKFFNIPDEFKEEIEKNHYLVTARVTLNDSVNKMVVIHCVLTITAKPHVELLKEE